MELISDILFSNVNKNIEDLEKTFPKRKEGLIVTRFAPSPTGFLHIGGVYTALLSRVYATQENGVFILRLEDTDKKREVKDAKEIILSMFDKLNIEIDEGITLKGQIGEYGPYIQSERVWIYHVVAKYLIDKRMAYPCFCTEEELEDIRNIQIKNKEKIGYYGKYAKYRDASNETIKKKIADNIPYTIRFRVPKTKEERISYNDLIKGHIEMDNNQNDFVLLKENGIPTYHFAHICDDYFMGTTHVIRGDEWMSSVPMHIQLFESLGFSVPKYAHVAPIMKIDKESRRKLSKRHDPESSAEYYMQKGYPVEGIYAYLYTLINSNFEEWYLENINKSISGFQILFSNMSVGGPLYDIEKLNNISSSIIYNMDNLLDNIIKWAKSYNEYIYNIISNDLELATKLIETQGKNSSEHRKDLTCFSDYDFVFKPFYEETKLDFKMIEDVFDIETINALIGFYKEKKEGSLKTLKDLSKELGYTNKKKYEKNKEMYRGVVFQFYKLLRVLITHQTSGIGIDDIVMIFGYEEIIDRLRVGLTHN